MGRPSLYEFKKKSIVGAINQLCDETGQSPTIREIADVTNMPISTLHSYLEKLRAEGLITWRKRAHRSLRSTNTTQVS